MSIEAMTWAMRHSQATLGARLVIFVLADCAHPDGTEAYPSVATIAERAHLSRRAVQLALRKLEDLGEIERDGVGRNGTACWRLNMGAQNLRGRTSQHEGGVTATPEPPVEPSTSSLGQGTGENGNVTALFGAQLLEDQSCGREGENGARDDLPTVTLWGKRVAPLLVADALRALEHFSQASGVEVRAVKATGRPTEALTMVCRAMRDHPEARVVWRRMIDCALAEPWWEGDPHVGVVFSPKVVERAIHRAKSGRPPQVNGRHLTPGGHAVARILAAEAEGR